MALTAKQRRRLPDSAFVYPSARKYPVPTRAQAKRAGISEAQRLRTHRNALSRAGQKGTSGAYSTVARKVRARAGGKVASVKAGGGGVATKTGGSMAKRSRIPRPTVKRRRTVRARRRPNVAQRHR